MMYVNVYIEQLVYGGPEEGGWYYHAGELVESISVDTKCEAEELHKKMESKWSNDGRRPISSVLSNGEYCVCIEDHFAESYPKYRPHYE